MDQHLSQQPRVIPSLHAIYTAKSGVVMQPKWHVGKASHVCLKGH